jgi:hypothetical protein
MWSHFDGRSSCVPFAHQELAAAGTRQAAVRAPGIGQPAIVVDRDLTRLEEAVADAQRIAAAMLAGTTGVGDGFVDASMRSGK